MERNRRIFRKARAEDLPLVTSDLWVVIGHHYLQSCGLFFRGFFFCDWHLAVLWLIHFCCFTVSCLLFYLLYLTRCLFPCIVLLFGACYCYFLYFSRHIFPCIVLLFSLLMKLCFFPKEQLIYIFYFSLNDRI